MTFAVHGLPVARWQCHGRRGGRGLQKSWPRPRGVRGRAAHANSRDAVEPASPGGRHRPRRGGWRLHEV